MRCPLYFYGIFFILFVVLLEIFASWGCIFLISGFIGLIARLGVCFLRQNGLVIGGCYDFAITREVLAVFIANVSLKILLRSEVMNWVPTFRNVNFISFLGKILLGF